MFIDVFLIQEDVYIYLSFDINSPLYCNFDMTLLTLVTLVTLITLIITRPCLHYLKIPLLNFIYIYIFYIKSFLG